MNHQCREEHFRVRLDDVDALLLAEYKLSRLCSEASEYVPIPHAAQRQAPTALDVISEGVDDRRRRGARLGAGRQDDRFAPVSSMNNCRLTISSQRGPRDRARTGHRREQPMERGVAMLKRREIPPEQIRLEGEPPGLNRI